MRVDYRDLIKKLEDEKWDIFLKYGEYGTATQWPVIDAKLLVLYRWLATDLGMT